MPSIYEQFPGLFPPPDEPLRIRGEADPLGHPLSLRPLPAELEADLQEFLMLARVDRFDPWHARISHLVDIARRRGNRTSGTALLVDPVNPDIGVAAYRDAIVFFRLDGRKVVDLHPWGAIERGDSVPLRRDKFLQQLLAQCWGLPVSKPALWRISGYDPI